MHKYRLLVSYYQVDGLLLLCTSIMGIVYILFRESVMWPRSNIRV